MTWEGTEENYNVFRWYRAGWGRYTQADPIGLHGELNLFGYAQANPQAATDPLGTAPTLPQFPGTTTDDCSLQEWNYCEGKCAPNAVLGCYVTVTHKLKTTKGFPQFKIIRTVNCNCKEDCQKSWPNKLSNWWKQFTSPPFKPTFPFLPPIIPASPAPEPVIPGLPPFFVNPCMLNPSLCGAGSGVA